MGAQLKIGSITLAHPKCTGWAGRITHSSRSVRRHESLGPQSNAPSAKQRHKDSIPPDTSFISLQSHVSEQERFILCLHTQADYLCPPGAALPRRTVCITKTPSCTFKVNITLDRSHAVMFNTFQDFCDDETLWLVSSSQIVRAKKLKQMFHLLHHQKKTTKKTEMAAPLWHKTLPTPSVQWDGL